MRGSAVELSFQAVRRTGARTTRPPSAIRARTTACSVDRAVPARYGRCQKVATILPRRFASRARSARPRRPRPSRTGGWPQLADPFSRSGCPQLVEARGTTRISVDPLGQSLRCPATLRSAPGKALLRAASRLVHREPARPDRHGIAHPRSVPGPPTRGSNGAAARVSGTTSAAWRRLAHRVQRQRLTGVETRAATNPLHARRPTERRPRLVDHAAQGAGVEPVPSTARRLDRTIASGAVRRPPVAQRARPRSVCATTCAYARAPVGPAAAVR